MDADHAALAGKLMWAAAGSGEVSASALRLDDGSCRHGADDGLDAERSHRMRLFLARNVWRDHSSP